MIDVHPPHHAATTWRDFFIHIATIVVGLLIAICLEQTVEHFHHRHQAEEMREALRSEAEENRDVGRKDIAALRVMIENVQKNREGLRSAAATKGLVFYEWQNAPNVSWLPLVDSAWLTARDSAAFSLLPPVLVRNRWRVEYTIQQTNEQGGSLFNTLFEMRSGIHQHGEQIRLTPDERADMIRTLTKLDGELRHLFSTMLYFDSANELYLEEKPIDLQNLHARRKVEARPPSW